MIQAQRPKGFRDFLPQEARKRNELIEKLKKSFETFGFDPLETPALEYASTLLGKYGEEADKLLYLFEDHGKRKIGLRYDQTVPLSRVIAQYPDLPMPFKRYQIQPVWRAENTQKGRFREFLQCDIDTIGSVSPLADAEIIACVLDVARMLRLPTPIVVINDRTLFDHLGLSKKEIIILDKLDKIGKDEVINQLNLAGFEGQKVFEQLEAAQKTERIQIIFEFLTHYGFIENKDFRFDPFLSRGLDYYTSTIFELKEPSYSAGSLAGGGRYDRLIGSFSGRETPAVGVAFGFDRLVDALEELGLLTIPPCATSVLVCMFSSETEPDSIQLAMKLRKHGVLTEVYLDSYAKLEKQLRYADKKGIPYVIIQGPQERKQQVVTLKNMKTKEQKTLTIEEVIRVLSAHDKI